MYDTTTTARIAGAMLGKFPGTSAMTIDSIVSEALLEAERQRAARGDDGDEMTKAIEPAKPPYAERDRSLARQDDALDAIKQQSARK